MGDLDDKGKQGTWIEGRESSQHEHKDGTRGTDLEGFRNTYKDGERVSSTKLTDKDDYPKFHQ